MTTLCVIQARLGGGTRFIPGQSKVLADLCGHPVLWHVVQRAKAIHGVDQVVLACPEADGPTLASLGLGVPVVAITSKRGEDDVLWRFARALRDYPAQATVRLTGDNPFAAPDLASEAVAALAEYGCLYAFTRYDGRGNDWPNGFDVEAMPSSLILAAHRDTRDRGDREHVTPWVRREAGPNAWIVGCPVSWPAGVKLSIDTPTDLDYARRVMARIQPGPTGYGWRHTYHAARGEDYYECPMSEMYEDNGEEA